MYFTLQNETDLVIKAKRKRAAQDSSEIIVLVPRRILGEDLPASLIEGHALWLNLSTSVLEICPFNSIWETSSENWKIDCIPQAGKYRMHKGHELLVDSRSPSWAMVSDLLKPLEASQNLLVTVASIDSGGDSMPSFQLSVVLPRYGLSFYVDEDGDFRSRNFRGMVYDRNQCIGTLFGLVNRLVLRPKITGVLDVVELIPRCVVIPEGEVSFQKLDDHVCVKVNTPHSSLDRVTYRTYRINTDLGCLETVGLTNKLHCAYLHALTSGCGIDPLTGRSGTEEALSLLWSASCWSIMKLSPRDTQLMSLIASICPSHTWHPEYVESMQQVKWLGLPANSQHPELYVVAKAIMTHYKQLLPFLENQSDQIPQKFPSQERHLLERSARRVSYLFPADSREPSRTNHLDIRYSARDLVERGSGEHRAYEAASNVYHQTAHAKITIDILGMVESWTSVSGPGDAPLSLRYDQSWLAPKLSSIWLETYNLLRTSGGRKRFQLLFTLPAMAYASPGLSNMVPVLVAFGSEPAFFSEDPPYYVPHTLSDKYNPSGVTLGKYIADSAYPFERSPESSKSPRRNKGLSESDSDLAQRQRKMYAARLDSDINATVNRLLLAWPCKTPPKCSLNRKLYDVKSFTTKARSHFSSCYRNLEFKEHLTRVQELLRNIQVSPIPTVQYFLDRSETNSPYVPWTLRAEQLFSRQEACLPEHATLPGHAADVGNTSFPGAISVQRLITTAQARATNPFQHRYISALRASAESFESKTSTVSHEAMELPDTKTLMGHYARCRATYTESVHRLQQHLGPKNRSERALQQSGQWPRMTPFVLLRFLASNSPVTLLDGRNRCLIRLALLALQVQRARRLLQLHLDNHHEELRRELQNEGCNGWSAEMHPDWLLVQVCSPYCRYVYLLTLHALLVSAARQLFRPSRPGRSRS